MEFKEYGKNNDETIMLLHGGGLSWWNYRNVAEQLRQDYHVILPVLDGLCPRDHGTQRLCALIGDAGIFPPRV